MDDNVAVAVTVWLLGIEMDMDDSTVKMKAGDVMVQRGTNHAWEAHGGPALLLGVLIDRTLAS